MAKSALTLKIFLAVLLNDTIDALAQVLMKKGLLVPAAFSLGVHDFIFFITSNAISPLVWIGIFLYTVNFFVWIAILSQIDLSLAIPLGSTTYLVIPLIAMVFLHEKMTLLRWGGVFLIIAGMYVLSKSRSLEPKLPVP